MNFLPIHWTRALRSLVRAPGYTWAAVATLALGIGATSAMFSVVNAVLLRPLPLPHPDRLTLVWEEDLARGAKSRVSPAAFADWRREATAFEGLALLSSDSAVLTDSGTPERLPALAVSAGFFETVGVAPALGRSFRPEDEQPGAASVAVLSHDLWQSRFGGDPGVVGRSVMLDDVSHTIVGVMPRSFRFPEPAEVWRPFVLRPEMLTEAARGARYVRVLARLRDGVTMAQAQESMTALAAAIGETSANAHGWGVRLEPLLDDVVAGYRTPLLVLWGAVGFVLLIACANVANLALARGVSRGEEMAVRAALGAGRARIVGLLLGEHLVLGLMGGVGGLLLAYWLVDPLVRLAPPGVPRLDDVAVDLGVVGFTCLLAVMAGLLSGLVPALRAAAAAPADALRAGRRAGGGPARRRLRQALVVAEIALSLVLLAGAGLFLRSLTALAAVEPGVRTRDVTSWTFTLPRSRYASPAQRRAFVDTVLDAIAAEPGVTAAGATTNLPLSGSNMNFGLRAPDVSDEQIFAQYHAITPKYLRTLDIDVLDGRAFERGDRETSRPVALVNETLARRIWPADDPVGRKITVASQNGLTEREIVGVVADVKHAGLAAETLPEVYVPYAQDPWGFVTLVLERPGPVAVVRDLVERHVRELDPALPIGAPVTMEQLLAGSLAPARFETLVLVSFSLLALLLAVVGLFGVISYHVRQRTGEIGLRMALGARRADVLRLVVGRGLGLTAAGLVLGLAVTLVAGRSVSSLLFGVAPADPVTLAAVAAILAVSATAACWLPARRAMRTDPAAALRQE